MPQLTTFFKLEILHGIISKCEKCMEKIGDSMRINKHNIFFITPNVWAIWIIYAGKKNSNFSAYFFSLLFCKIMRRLRWWLLSKMIWINMGFIIHIQFKNDALRQTNNVPFHIIRWDDGRVCIISVLDADERTIFMHCTQSQKKQMNKYEDELDDGLWKKKSVTRTLR